MKRILAFLYVFYLMQCFCNAQQRIDRKALVERHTIVNTPISFSSLSVGNGRFAFTVDITGLQSFPGHMKMEFLLVPKANGVGIVFPNTNIRFEETLQNYHLEWKRSISYSVQLKEPVRNKNAVEWFRQNPHRLQLGNIGFEY